MKKTLLFLTAAFVMNATAVEALPPPPLLDDSASFRIAKSVKLGNEDGKNFYGNTNAGGIAGTECLTNSDCDDTQKCKDGKCESVCSPNPCPDGKECIPENHAAKCGCTDTSCGTGLKCVDSDCVPCTKGDKCGCAGSKVFDGESGCYCAGETACSAAKEYSEDLCSCKSCDLGKKCGCAGKSVSDGFGACVCLEDEVCDPGNKQDKTTCTCTPCAAGDNAGCETPCPEGQVPDGKGGCGTYACTSDSDCPEGNQCKNPSTLDAYCDPCTRGTSCNCPAGKVADGTGNCVAIACDADATCSGEMCCKLNPAYGEGYTCANGGSVDAICVLCEIGTQCTCDDGYIVNDQYKCVKPECKTNSDCPNGKYCENPGKSNAECVPCKEGEPCPTCPTGYVADGNGGCKLGCTFDTAPLCVSGTTNCKTCTQSGGCYTCTDCKDGYYPDNGTCVSCKQKFGDDCKKCTPNKCTICDDGYEPDPYTGKCKPKACPSGYSTSVTSCGNGYTLTTNGYSAGKPCGYCEPNACPSGYSTSVTSCGNGYTLTTNGYSGGSACGKCEEANCPDGYSTSVTSCNSCSTFSQSGYSAGNPCGKCTPKTCSSVSCDESKGYTASTDSCGCTTCAEKACPSGYSTSTTSCGSGYTLKTSGYSAGKACGKCEPNACPSGYSTSVSSCGNGYTLTTNGYSGGKACGYCQPKPCPSGYDASVSEAQCQGSKYETNGYFGSLACGRCLSRPDCRAGCYWTGTRDQAQTYCRAARSCPAGYNKGYNSSYWSRRTCDDGEIIYCMTSNMGCCYK